MKILESRISKGWQDVTYTEIYEQDGRKFRIRIKSDTVNSQSYAILEVLQDNLSWTVLENLRSSEMKTPSGLVHTNNVSKIDFGRDIMYLRDLVNKLTK